MQLSPRYRKSFRTCSKLDAILRRFLTKLNHKGPLGRFCHAGFQFVFVLVMANTNKKEPELSMSSPSTGNSISDTQTGSSSRQLQSLPQYSCLSVHFRVVKTKEIQTNKEKDRVETKELVCFCKQSVYTCAIANLLLKVTVFHGCHLKSRRITVINCTKSRRNCRVVYRCDFEVASSCLAPRDEFAILM